MTDSAANLKATLDQMLSMQDRGGAVRAVIASVASNDIDIPHLYTEVLSPLLVETGLNWQSGDVRVWQEHYASATIRTIIEALYPTVLDLTEKIEPLGRSVLLACPPREQHDLGLRMIADRFALAGWTVHYLGTDTPIVEIADAANQLGCELTLLSASTHFNRALLRDVVDHLVKATPDTRVMVGGPAFLRDRDWPEEELFDPVAFGLPPKPEVR